MLELKNYISIIPLIGGMYLGAKKYFKKEAEYILSYTPFFGNDNLLLNYLNVKHNKNVKYLQIDNDEHNTLDYVKSYHKKIDLVMATPPCAGLSMLNVKASADYAANDWLYTTAHFVLKNVKPKVLLGENAPGLYTKMGIKVVDKLKKIAKQYNYKLLLIKVNTEDHGIPQRRIRTFFYFIDGNIPKIKNIKRDTPELIEYLKLCNINDTEQHINANIERHENDIFCQFYTNIYGKNFKSKLTGISTFMSIVTQGLLNKFYDFCIKKENKVGIKIVKNYKKKIAMGKGIWDYSPMYFNKKINAVVGRNLVNALHPTENRFMLNCEFLHLMGFPNDFKLIDDNKDKYKIAQNVPVNTARDAIEFITNFNETFDDNVFFVKYNNIKDNIDCIEKNKNKTSILDF